MLIINIKRSVAALAITAGLLTAAAPPSHAYSWGVSNPSVKAPVSSQPPSGLKVTMEDILITSVRSGATHSSAKVSTQDGHASKKAKRGKGKRGKGKPKHTYDIQSSNHV